jgi:hypothetical protein
MSVLSGRKLAFWIKIYAIFVTYMAKHLVKSWRVVTKHWEDIFNFDSLLFARVLSWQRITPLMRFFLMILGHLLISWTG